MAKAPEPAPDGEGEPQKKKLAGKTLVLFILLPALIILGGGGATAFFLFGGAPAEEHAGADADKEAAKAKDAKAKKSKHAKAEKGKGGKEGEEAGPAVEIAEGPEGVLYYPLPEMLVNITTGDGRPVYLKLRLTVEVRNEEAIDALEPAMPRILDHFQSFLRELRVDDIAGSAGAYRLRLELLRRVNLAIAPAEAEAVLIEDMLVQ